MIPDFPDSLVVSTDTSFFVFLAKEWVGENRFIEQKGIFIKVRPRSVIKAFGDRCDARKEGFIALARKIRDERAAAAVKEADEWLENVIKYVVPGKVVDKVALQRAQEPVSAPISSTKRIIPKDSQSPTVLLLRKHIKAFGDGEFSTVEIREQIEKETGVSMNTSQKASFSSYLQQMERGGEIELVKRGRGSMPSVYKAKDG